MESGNAMRAEIRVIFDIDVQDVQGESRRGIYNWAGNLK